MPDKNLAVTHEFKEQVREFAWRSRLSMIEVINAVIADYANHKFDVPPKQERVTLNAEIKYTEPPEYAAAMERAQTDGVPLSEVIRVGLLAKMEEGLPGRNTQKP